MHALTGLSGLSGEVATLGGFLLLEDGTPLLLEDGTNILL
jgi:hypothetical protein